MDYLELLKQVGILCIGFILLLKGADWFVEGASKLADRFGIPQLIIGLTIVAMGTSAPEAAISIKAAISGDAGISIGNVVGSNIMNILFILGLTAIIIAIPLQKSTLCVEIPFMIFITGLLLFLGMQNQDISRIDGGIFWLLFIAFLCYLLIMAKKGKNTSTEEEKPKSFGPKWKNSIWLILLLIAIGAVMIVFGADITVKSASSIADMFGMSDRIIGLTIVAFGTSLPELITSLTAALKKKADIAIGNIVGSNIFNILFVCGTAALIHPIPFENKFILDSIIAIVTAVLLFLFVLKDRKLKRLGGFIMLGSYIAYLTYTIMA